MNFNDSKASRYLIGVLIGVSVSLLALFAYLAIDSSIVSRSETFTEINGKVEPVSGSETLALADSGSGSGHDLPELEPYTSDLARSAALYALLEQSDIQDLIDLIRRSIGIEHPGRRHETMIAIGQRIASIDPNTGLEVAMEFPLSIRAGLLTGVFQEWSLANLDNAIASALTLDKPSAHQVLRAILHTRSDLSDSVRREIAKKLGREETAIELITAQTAESHIDRPQEAWKALMQDGIDNAYQMRHFRDISRTWAETEGFDILHEIQSSLDSTGKYSAQQELIRSVVEIDPQQAFDHVFASKSGERQYLLLSVVAEWAQNDPKAAFETVAKIKEDSESKQLLREVVSTWASNDPERILEDLDKFDTELRLVAAESAVGAIGAKDPERATAIVEELQTKVSNTSMIARRLSDLWTRSDPRSALDWILSDSQKDNTQRNQMIKRAIRALAHEDPHHAFEVGLEQPLASEHNSGMESDVILELTSIDIETAISLLPNVREKSILISHIWVGAALVKTRQPHRALELAQQVPEARRDYYYETIGEDWAETNPTQLFEELDQLPNPKLKSAMAKALLSSDSNNPVLTPDQVDHVRSLLNAEDAETEEESTWRK